MTKYTVIPLNSSAVHPASILYNRAMRLIDHIVSDDNISIRNSAGIHSMSTSNFPKINFGVMKKGDKFTKFIMDVALAGYDLDKIDIEVNHRDRTLTIKYEDVKEKVIESEEVYISIDHEIKSSSFDRSFTAPDEADLTNIAKSYSDGILRLEIPIMDSNPNTTKIKIKD